MASTFLYQIWQILTCFLSMNMFCHYSALHLIFNTICWLILEINVEFWMIKMPCFELLYKYTEFYPLYKVLGDCSVILIFLEKWYSRAYVTNQVTWTLNHIINGEFLLIVFVCHFRIMRVTYFQAISNLLHCASQPGFTYSKSIK